MSLKETNQSHVWVPNRRLYFTLPEQNFILYLVQEYLNFYGESGTSTEIALKLKEDFTF
jgi:hypothetical protein